MSTSEDYSALLNTLIHEFGHALGLGHNDVNDVMYYKANSVTTLSTNDKRSYDAAYSHY